MELIKQLEDGHTLFDYNVGLNEIIQLMVRAQLPPVSNGDISSGDESGASNKENCEPEEEEEKENTGGKFESTSSQESVDSGFSEGTSTYKTGDMIDARDPEEGAWFEATIKKITRACDEDSASTSSSSSSGSENEKHSTSSTSQSSSDHKKVENNEKTPEITDQNDNTVSQLTDKEKQETSDNCSKTSESETMETDVTKQTETLENSNDLTKETNKTSCNAAETMETSENTSTDADKDNAVVEATLEKIPNDDFIYHVVYEGYEEDDLCKIRSSCIRPRARTKIPLKNLEIGQRVMVNYNIDDWKNRGYWFDAVVTRKRDTRTIKELYCTVFLGANLMPLHDCQIWFYDEVFEIEKPGTQLNKNDPGSAQASPVKRKNKPDCDHCLDNPRKKCKECACHVCGGKQDPEKQIMCDECDYAYHLGCLKPPLEQLPEEDEWYCYLCKNDASEVVKAGEKLKASKKKSKMASANSTSTRDWGKGMACAGRSTVCNIVPANHFGPIPGIEVGMSWKFRVQVSEAGVHRPHVAGIHGRDSDGAYSIVLSGGYEDDVDEGDVFTYTGSGGRDLSGNKRTAEQSCDQTLTRMNRALAKGCKAPLDDKKGGDAGADWRKGKPVRVVRSCKGRKHSKYAPEEGNRYDGIYKVVKFWPEKGKSGFIVWRYKLKRDDPTPGPWTKEGKKRIKELGLTLQYPAGYLENEKAKQAKKEAEAAEEVEGKGKGKKGKRKREESESSATGSTPEKRQKVAKYKLSPEVSKLVKEDKDNEKLWEEALATTKEGAQKFFSKVEELFLCICCQDVAFKPITTKCQHNICKPCLARSFKAEVYCCPMCRTELGKDYSMAMNKTLSQILNLLFPGYENGR